MPLNAAGDGSRDSSKAIHHSINNISVDPGSGSSDQIENDLLCDEKIYFIDIKFPAGRLIETTNVAAILAGVSFCVLYKRAAKRMATATNAIGTMENNRSLCVSSGAPSDVTRWEKGMKPAPIEHTDKMNQWQFHGHRTVGMM
jgi:hypothetical protein